MAIGLYLHIPFCASKCPYCDFYSLVSDEATWDAYTAALCASVERWAERTGENADTLYLGGGTPSLLGPERLERILQKDLTLGVKAQHDRHLFSGSNQLFGQPI